MKYKDKRVLLLIILLIMFQSGMYMVAKITPFEFNLVGNLIDSKIPFIAHFIYPYISWYLMLVLVPFMFYKSNKLSFNNYYVTTFLCICFVFFIYFFYPTTMVRADIVSNSISEYLVNFIYKIDTPILNCFPSMHCIISFIFIYVALLDKDLKLGSKIFIILWALSVVLSTVFIKQHVFVDVVSAFIVSIVMYVIVKKIKYLNDFDVIKR